MLGGYAQKWVRPFRSYGTKIWYISHMIWWIKQIDWMILHFDSDSMIFGLITSLLCIYDICWVPFAVVLVKNDVLFLVPAGKVLELGFPKCFLIKAWLSVKRLFPAKNIWKMTRNLGAHPAWHSSYMVITLYNLKILLSLLLLSHPTISNFYQLTNWNFSGLVIQLNYNYYY